MPANELDDLFRQQLDDHASAPGADLWARLQARTTADAAAGPAADAASGASGPVASAAPFGSVADARAAEQLDARFRAGLAGHATPPRRELWERLEDEHLRPSQRRRPVVAWGRLAVAASLLLLVLGGGLWLGRGSYSGSPVATTTTPTAPALAANPVPTNPTALGAEAAAPAAPASAPAERAWVTRPSQPATGEALLARAEAPAVGPENSAKIFARRATAASQSPSTTPEARTAWLRRPATASPAPDKASLAGPGGRNTPDAHQPAGPAPVLAVQAPAPAAEPEIILVEVRRGPQPAAPLAPAVAMAAAETRPAPRRRLRLGGLLRQADNLVHGDPVVLADAGLPDSLTIQARLGGRTLSHTLRL